MYLAIGRKVKVWTPPPILFDLSFFDIPPFKDFLNPQKIKALKVVKRGCCHATDIVLKSTLNKGSNEWTKTTAQV